MTAPKGIEEFKLLLNDAFSEWAQFFSDAEMLIVLEQKVSELKQRATL